MIPHTHNRRETKFPGITRHAEQLGCTRMHLYLVLVGARTSKKLLPAYKALLRSEGKVVPPELVKRKA